MTDESALIVLQKDRVYMKTAVNYDLAVEKSVEALKLKPVLEQENRRLKGAIKEYCEQNCLRRQICSNASLVEELYCSNCPLNVIGNEV